MGEPRKSATVNALFEREASARPWVGALTVSWGSLWCQIPPPMRVLKRRNSARPADGRALAGQQRCYSGWDEVEVKVIT